MYRFFRKPALSDSAVWQIQIDTQENLGISIDQTVTEWCFYIETKGEALNNQEMAILQWLLAETFEPDNFDQASFVEDRPSVLEIGPRLNFETAWSSTAVSIFHACGLNKVIRIERSLRFGLSENLTPDQAKIFLAPLHDRMTQMSYSEPLKSFDSGLRPEAVEIIPVIEQGMDALRKINKERGFAMDEQDLQMFHGLVEKKLKRNPTNTEIAHYATCNNEHSRHGFFNGKLVINGKIMPETLMEIVKTPWQVNPENSLIAFCDDGSAIKGSKILTLVPRNPGQYSSFHLDNRFYNPTLTAETHNHPCAIDPYPGGGTGAGGRIRDNQVVGRGGLVIAGGAGYCTDNLHIPGYKLPWEDDGWFHPSKMASPLDILIRESDGSSDYGNYFGEPTIYGFTRSFGLELVGGREGWFKPIMYTIGVGQIDDRHIEKGDPKKGMLIVRIGGPGYRIGVGGGPASSMIQGENTTELDFDSVQRAAPEMEQRMNRLFRACVELGDDNPTVRPQDEGAGGECNALSELAGIAGALIELRDIPLGDKSLSVMDIWRNEAQERSAILIRPDRFDQIKKICDRENIPCVVVGTITGDGWLTLHDENDNTNPVKLPLEDILEAPQKTFEIKRVLPKRKSLKLPENITIKKALERVLRLPSVGSKRYLTTKVDRSVTGLIAQQQCVGPSQITLCDYAVVAQSHFGLTGTAVSLGEQPIKGLISPQAMARLAVTEALLNMAGAKITQIEDIKCSANWMLAAKLDGEGAWLYDAALALRDICIQLGIAIDGGKDSLSMAAKTNAPDGSEQIVKAPGQLVIGAYAPMPDITCKVTPDLKKSGNHLLFIDLSLSKNRLGGSALAQVYKQVGNDCPDLEDIDLLSLTFKIVQKLVEDKLILSLHDRSDGGLITTILEMAFAGNLGFRINLQTLASPIHTFFNEEPGLVIECDDSGVLKVKSILQDYGIPFQAIGKVISRDVIVKANDKEVLEDKMIRLRQIWEETSTQIDQLQANSDCVKQEAKENTQLIDPPAYRLSFSPEPTSNKDLFVRQGSKVAILRTEGSNGDREMASAFFSAGFEVWDVTISDLLSQKANLDDFQGIAFVGGFAYADVMNAGKGWAGTIRFNEQLAQQFKRFYEKSNTFSLGVCNGCQLMALLGWIPWPDLSDKAQPRFIQNRSERFESRFSMVKILPSPAIMLKSMEHSILGIWVAHGEGRLHLRSEALLGNIKTQGLAPIRFVDPSGEITEKYPFNPNGSPEGITALCSRNGRHLAMMPHPERTFLKWQMPWMPSNWQKLKASPWLKLFQNAKKWCEENK